MRQESACADRRPGGKRVLLCGQHSSLCKERHIYGRRGYAVRTISRRLGFLALLLVALGSRAAFAQTPSPLQEWQYSGGVILARLFQPDLPQWRHIVGLGADVQPVYDGAHAYRVSGGPVLNFYYKDVAFITTGEGL